MNVRSDNILSVKLLAAAALLPLILCSCGAPPKPKATVPALNPEGAYELLRYDTSATNWLTHVRQSNPACDWHIEFPDQSNQPTEIDADQIIWCSGRPAPLEYRAKAIFTYDPATAHWKLTRFSS